MISLFVDPPDHPIDSQHAFPLELQHRLGLMPSQPRRSNPCSVTCTNSCGSAAAVGFHPATSIPAIPGPVVACESGHRIRKRQRSSMAMTIMWIWVCSNQRPGGFGRDIPLSLSSLSTKAKKSAVASATSSSDDAPVTAASASAPSPSAATSSSSRCCCPARPAALPPGCAPSASSCGLACL